MKIRTRIMGLVFALLLLMAAAVFFFLRELRSIGGEIEELTSNDIPLTESVIQITSHTLEQAVNFERALRYATQAESGDASFAIPIKDARLEFNRLRQLVHEAIDRAKQLTVARAGKAVRIRPSPSTVAERLRGLEEAYEQYEKHGSIILELLERGETKEAKLESLAITGEEERLRHALQALSSELEMVRRESSVRANQTQQTALKGMVAISGISLVVGLVLALIIAWSITSPLSAAVRIADQIAAGSKNVEVNLNYDGEVGQLLAAMKNMLESVGRSEKALRERATELARSNSELEQFAYIASHDLQEPLRMVACFTQLLARRYEGKLDPEADEFIGFATDGVHRMQNLINDLLSYSRVGKDAKAFSEISLKSVLSEAASNLRTSISETGAKIDSEALPTVHGDETQLVQLFQNLIGNAIKFRKSDEPPLIKVAAERNENEWQITISDNGIGIEPQYAQRIFNIFQRLHAASEYPGTGIGLAICKKIAERHGGRIWVESRLGDGATFRFTIADPVRSA